MPAKRPARRGPDPLPRLRAICMALPEAVEKRSHGEPTWFAGKGKLFAMLDDHHHRSPHLCVSSIKHQNLRRQPDHYVYAPFAQAPQSRMDIVLRSAGGAPAATAAALRAELKAVDPALPLFEVRTLEQAISDSLLLQRLVNGLLLTFALAALLLASIGIYGVMALNVSHRINEFGIRLALGATPAELRALVLRQGMRLVVVGAGLGLAGAAGLTRYLGTLLFQVPPLDPATFAAVTLALLGAALLACYIPARRATTLDPLAALRRE